MFGLGIMESNTELPGLGPHVCMGFFFPHIPYAIYFVHIQWMAVAELDLIVIFHFRPTVERGTHKYSHTPDKATIYNQGK